MMLHWTSEPDRLQTLTVCCASLLMFLTLIPGTWLIFRGALHSTQDQSNPAAWLLTGIINSLAWCILIYSLTFGPSAGMEFEETRSNTPTDMQTMLDEDAQSEHRSHLIGRGGWIGGLDFVFFKSLTPEGNSSEPMFSSRRPQVELLHLAFLLQQMVIYLAAITALLLLLPPSFNCGMLILFTMSWGLLIYAPTVHWVWGDGWLSLRKAVDAGAGLLHLNLGFSALGFLICGSQSTTVAQAREGGLRFAASDTRIMTGIFLYGTGAMLLNATRAMESPALQAGALLNSYVAGCTGAVGWSVASLLRGRTLTLSDIAFGSIAGITAISGGCTILAPTSALITGLAGGGSAFVALTLIPRDRSTQTARVLFSVLGIPAAAGLLFTGIFAFSGLGARHWDESEISGLVDGELSLLSQQALLLTSVSLTATAGTMILIHLSRICSGNQSEKQPRIAGDAEATATLDNS